jgi:malate dehydrogenase (oxaloacetate-decarboxylating)(NADP+)
MKMAAVKALTMLAREPVPELVSKAYGRRSISFGKDYLIPKPFDPRLITTISPAVAKAAIDSGVSRVDISNWEQYHQDLQKRIGIHREIASHMMSRARKNPKRVVFAEADNYKILRAAEQVIEEGIAHPILLGNKEHIKNLSETYNLELTDCTIIDTSEEEEKTEQYGRILYEKRKRKGLTYYEGKKLMRDRNYFGTMMVEQGEADVFISGLTKDYPKTIIPALQVIGTKPEIRKVAGMYVISNKKRTYFFADTTVNVNPTAEDLVDIIGLTANAVKFFNVEPRMAVLSYSNFGSSKGDVPIKTARAAALAKEKFPDLVIEGDIQANVALNTEIQQTNYPFSELAEKGANTLIFPDLDSGNIAYKLLMEIGGAEAIGPILMGMNKPVHVLQLGSSVREIIHMVAIAVVEAQINESPVPA